MRQISQNYNTGEITIEEVPIPAVNPGGVLVKNYFSLVSAGTEKAIIELAQKSLVGKAKARPDLVKQVIGKVKQEGLINTIKKVRSRLDVPLALGYSCAGVVTAVGEKVDEFQIGDRVACAGMGYAGHAEVVFVPKNLCAKVPENVDFEAAAFTTMGAIALQGVRQAQLTLGEKVAVIGLGLLGQITVQLVKANGCQVLGIDLDAEKVALAEELGADCAITRQSDVVGRASDFSEGRGIDAVIITAATSSNDPIELAGELCRDKGRVVVVGEVKMDIPRKLYYEKELDLRLSRSYGPGRYDAIYEEKGIDYPFGYVRWTEQRNMTAFLELLSLGKVNVKRIITHRFEIDEAQKAYELITGKNEEKYIGILLQYPQGKEYQTKVLLQTESGRKTQTQGTRVNVGLIGAGNFARSVILPSLKRIKDVNFIGIATATGLSSKNAGDKFGFEYCTSDYSEVLADEQINCVIIATRHNLHARLAIEALKKGKTVFVEKPLALLESELKEIIEVRKATDGRLMVGFNRRFSPFTQEVKRFFEYRQNPLIINYRVNAGVVSPDHWVQDPQEGGGRIIGEVCHFVDLMQYLLNSRSEVARNEANRRSGSSQPVKVYAEPISGNNSSLINNDNVNITLKFADGSVGTISYVANADPSVPKERVEIFGENSVAIIDDYRQVKLTKGGKTKTLKRFNQDKGHLKEFEAFVKSIKNGGELPLPFVEAVIATLVTFKIHESINTGMPVLVSGEW